MKHLHFTVITVGLWVVAIVAPSPEVQGFALMAALIATLELLDRE